MREIVKTAHEKALGILLREKQRSSAGREALEKGTLVEAELAELRASITAAA